MKKAKKLGLQSLALVLMAFVLVAGVAFGMTGAWFTDQQTQAKNDIQMGQHVEIADFSLENPTITGSRVVNDVITPDQDIADNAVMPGDVITFNFNLAKAANTEDYVARMNITVQYNGAALGDTKFDYEQTVAEQDYTNGRDIIVGTTKAVEIKITLKGAAFVNADALKGLTVSVEVKAVQAANYTTSGDDAFDWATYTFETWTA